MDKFLLIHFYKKKRIFFLLDIKTNQLTPIPLEGYSSLMRFDENELLWFATLEGIDLINIQPIRFDIYPEAFKTIGIWANDDFVFTGSEEGQASYRFNVKTKEAELMPNLSMFSTAQQYKQAFWNVKNNITLLNPLDYTVLKAIPSSKTIKGNIWTTIQDKEKRWWAGFSPNIASPSLIFYDPNHHDSLRIYEQYNDFDYLKKAFIIHLLEEDNFIWASSDKGLILIDKEKGVTAHYHKEASKAFQLPFNDIHFLHQDKNQVYWAATNYNGLVRFTLDEDKKVVEYKQYTNFNNLSSNVLYTIYEDDKERLWMSTLSGISCFNKQTEEVLTFSTKDGLPNNEFNRISGFQAANGRIYFGTLKGAVGFHPDSLIQKQQYQPKLLISAVHKYSSRTEQLIEYTQEVLTSQTIVQEPHERFFTIEVALTDYFHSKALRYFYKIQGLHEDYRIMEGNSVQLSNLPYGQYQLHIKGQAADRRFSDNEIVLSLHIVRPIYLRWWFILLVVASIILGSWQFYNYRVAQLKRQKIILENTVAERTQQIRKDKQIIEQQAEELKTLDKLKDRFFTNISHELRTPLTLILSPLGTLLKSSNLSNKEHTLTRVIQRHAQYLLKRINEIMELNRLEVNKSQLNPQPIRFYDFVKVAVSNFESIAPQKNITFIFDYQLHKELQILLDKDKYEHIIYNYLSNAFKYTAKDGQVEVTLKEQHQKIVLAVKDTGVGIPTSDIPHLFDRFYQADTAQKASSSGIGLALCREIATLMNGKVWVESDPDSNRESKGSVFYFEMPYKEVLGEIRVTKPETQIPISEIQIPIPQIPKSKSQNQTILLVEDNPDLRAYIQSILSEFYDVETAENGREALKRLTDLPPNPLIPYSSREELSELSVPPFRGLGGKKPSIVISDIMMPVMDGFELLEAIKKSDELRHIPMIMLTARTSIEAKLSALQLGVDDYITKPFNEEELLIRVQNLLKNQQERLAFIQENDTNTSEVAKEKASPNIDLQISESDQKWLQKVEQVVNENLHDSQFTKIAWANEMTLSERQLRRKIKQLTGLTLTKYMQIARLRAARQILEQGEKSTVAEVAYTVGFETPKYFSKLFFEEYGKKPITYFR